MSSVSKVVFGNTTVMDITDSTVNANNLLSGNKAYGADGEPVFGSLSVGSTINVTTTDSRLFGETLTLSDGTTTLSTTFDNSGDATFTSVLLIGILTLSCGGFSTTISVPSYSTYNVEFVTVPQGSTVTPTDDIQIWLKCAHITDKAYTTLAEVLADEVTYETLLRDSNACDYMVRSTSWALVEGLVPTMTSATTPSGTVITNSLNSSYPAWKAFDDTYNSTFWATVTNVITNSYLGYDFGNPIEITRIGLINASYNSSGSYNQGVQDYDIKYSDDNNTWQVVKSGTATKATSTSQGFEYIDFESVGAHRYWIIYCKNNYGDSYNIVISQLQFFDKADITTNKTAMRYLGKYDYACKKLLGNATWREAICNSDYFEEVLNVKVPVMTGNTAPSGKCSTSSVYSSTYAAYKAFNGVETGDTNRWATANGISNATLTYQFPIAIVVNKVYINNATSASITIQLKGSNDGSTYQDIDSAFTVSSTGNITQSISNNASYKYYSLYCIPQSGSSVSFWEVQFYGRALSEIIIPLVPTMTSNTTPSGVASADSIDGTGYEAYRAFDNAGSTTDAWISGSAASSYTYPHWIQYQFPTAQVVGGLHFKNYSTGSNGVKTFKVQGSNDGTTWTDLYSGTGTNAGGGTLQEFYFDNTTAYLYYRLYITEGYSAIQCGICYLQFLRTQSLTNIIHSCANDTIYYIEGGSPIIIATTNSSGIGICDFSLLDDKVYTLYSTVAKDPSNLSNPYSKQVRITKSPYGGTTEIYLMPDTIRTLYWWGYERSDLDNPSQWPGQSANVACTKQTNYYDATPSSSQYKSIGKKDISEALTRAHAVVDTVSGTSIYDVSLFFTTQTTPPTFVYVSTLALGLKKLSLDYSNTVTVPYAISVGAQQNNSAKIYALWYE